MNKEEKKAYKILKYQKNYVNIKTLFKEIDVILDLVDKQQKEIEELEDFIKHAQIIVPFENTNIKENEHLADIVEVEHKTYISKDKIKEKIKELERLNKEQEIPVLKEYKFIRKEMIDYFKELIGEE